MMLPQCSHITRKRGGVYYYRRRLPLPFSGEVALSLGALSFRAAEAIAQALDHPFRTFLSQQPMPDFDVQKTLRDYLRKSIENLKNKHFDAPAGRAVHMGGDYSQDEDAETFELMLPRLKQHLRERDVGPVKPVIAELSEGHSLTDRQQVELGLGILQVQVQLLEQSRKWLTEGLIGEIEPVEPEMLARAPITNGAVQEAIVTSRRLSEVLPAFLELMKTEESWTGQTLAQNMTTYRLLQEWCGDRPITEYTRRDFAGFYDMLRGLPKLYSKSAEWRGLSLRDIVDRSKDCDVERLSMKTIKRHFSAVGRLYSYLEKRGEYEGKNPAYGFEFPDNRRARDGRKVWSSDQLRTLFASPVWSGCASPDRRSKPGSLVIKDEKYWLPLLGIFHGNRLEEFAQLLRSDIKQKDDIWYFDINDELEKQLKNAQSRRRVPIHPRLLAFGFLDYVEDIAPNDGDRIFPKLNPGGPDNKLGYYFTKWWTNYRRAIGIYEDKLDYHSFRHNVTNALAAHNVSVDIRNELLGREGGTVDQRFYLKGLPLPNLHEAICLVQWPEIVIDGRANQ